MLRTAVLFLSTRCSAMVGRAAAGSAREYGTTPRAAVAVALRRNTDPTPSYLLVKRSKPPGKGKWSLPGGGIELGEATVHAARRELEEECMLSHTDVQWSSRPFTTTDAIVHDADGAVQFHYLIAQFYGEAVDGALPIAGDDALEVQWWLLDEVIRGTVNGLSLIHI